jgi:hypothetical protein
VESSSRVGRVGQCHGDQERRSGRLQVDQHVQEGSRVLRLEGVSRTLGVPASPRGNSEHRSRRTVESGELSHRLATSPVAISESHQAHGGADGSGSVRVSRKLPSPKVLFASPLPSCGGNRRFSTRLAKKGRSACTHTPDTDRESFAEATSRGDSPAAAGSASVGVTALVANPGGDDEVPTRATPQPAMDNGGPDGELHLAVPVAIGRVGFIRKFAARESITSEALEHRWRSNKNGYPRQHDRPFAEFEEWWLSTYPNVEFCPSSLRPGLIEQHLRKRADEGTHHDLLRMISTSISMACVEATDGRIQPGTSFTIVNFMRGQRRHRPARRKDNGNYQDVALLCQAKRRGSMVLAVHLRQDTENSG